MKKTSQKIGFKKLTLSNLSNEALESLKGGSSYVTYNCPPSQVHTCNYSCGCVGESRIRPCLLPMPVEYEP
jgi:hypothetical protein